MTYFRWNAQFVEGDENELLSTASLKLTNGPFDVLDPNHVLAVLSQRICVDLVMANSEVDDLTDQSVAAHMRLLTGFSRNARTFYTYSPSEPLLTLAAFELLYNRGSNRLPHALNTFNQELCAAGLIEKGLLGELGGRLLLLVARDLVAPENEQKSRDLLKPVLLMDFLDKLFGRDTWCDPHRDAFMEAFKDTYVNFTHWIVTKDPLPEVSDPCVHLALFPCSY